MKNNKPTISFVTPNFNDGKTIERMVDSIMDQDYPEIEQIIVDDGSTDDSKKVLKKLDAKYPKLKVIYLKENKGACFARNEGAKLAKGKYISFLPADAKLYPGMARIWVETLEARPEFDFIYGGYKFTDDNYHEVLSYLSEEFDPYFLKVTNYIDGSFPLKKTLFDKMGGWDTSIKSLQDWDFWLNAVLNHGAKGLYRKEVFFETTYPHPGGLSDDSNRNWMARMEQIKNKYNIPVSKICVTGAGAAFHAKNVAKILGADYLPMPSFKPHNYEMIYNIGFFGNVAQSLWNTNALRVLHWIGSDILQVKHAEPKVRTNILNWLDNNIDIHLCEMEQTRRELEELGIKARIVPFPPQSIYEPTELPEKFGVAVYMPYNNKEFYYPDFIMRVAKRLKDVDFHLFGDPLTHGDKDNVFYHGIINKADKADLVKKTSMILRLTPHDGLPLSVVEWITAGRNAITTIDIPHSMKFDFTLWKKKKQPTKAELELLIKKNEKRLVEMIKRMKKAPVNKKGAKHYQELCDPEVFKKKIYSFLDIDIKAWWKEMSDIWPAMESNQETSEDIGKILTEVRKLKPKSVLDLGCGTGRWSELMGVKNYTGLDFAPELIEDARKKYPDTAFVKGDIVNFAERFKEEKYDLVFTFATLLHVKPKDIKKYVKAIKKLGKIGLFVEPVSETRNVGRERSIHPEIIKKQKEKDFIFNVKYTWIHDYLNEFEVIKVIKLSHNRNLFIVDLTKNNDEKTTNDSGEQTTTD